PSPTKLHTLSLHDALPISSPKKADVIAGGIIEHCLDYFVVSEAPHIVILDPGHDAIDLNHLYASEVRRSSTSESFEVAGKALQRSEEHTSELQSPDHLVCR